jgi:histidinol dehydrogenase
MPLRLSTQDPHFATAFRSLLATKREAAVDVDDAVRAIVSDVRARGDAALIELTGKLDHFELKADQLAFTPAEIAAEIAKCAEPDLAALKLAAQRIESFHQRQRPKDDLYFDETGTELGLRWTPVSSVGLYVPGGKAAYPSSVLMNGIPARVAGVPRIAMTVPTPNSAINPLVLAAAHIAGVTEIYRVGGAQAVAALAYGTPSIMPVDKIVGPGNAYVAAAKRQVFGQVGIDSIAGPSEILIVADRENDPAWIAIDLLSQAEHDEAAQSILITDDAAFADSVAQEVARQLKSLPRAAIAGKSWEDFGAIILVRYLSEAPGLIDAIAPEHVEIATENPDAIAQRIRNAGAIFLGCHTPEAIGDYVAGPNHVLPTARSARFSSGLSVWDFMKRTTLVRATPASLAAIGPAAMTLADAEGLGAHKRSIEIRLNRR